jgi:sigma-B regulation protein RsbU (phosphoserine phosphatase)
MSPMPARGLKQLALFKPPLPPERGGSIDVHALSLPAQTFTGDFYFTHRSGPRFWFAHGDVAGKGLNAAVIMAMIQEELEHRITSCAVTACDPSATMLRLHTFLKSVLPSNKFATAIIGFLHDDGTLAVVNAGHCPLLILRLDGTIEEVGSSGPVVGLLSDAEWQSVSTSIKRGERIVLFSDGLLEARSVSGDEFGISNVRSVLEAAGGSDVRGMTSALLTAVERHSPGLREDDLTIVALQRQH